MGNGSIGSGAALTRVPRVERAAAAGRREAAGVLLVTVAPFANEIRLLGREFHPVTDYTKRTRVELDVPSRGYMKALARGGSIRATALFIHSHIGRPATPSRKDDRVDAELRDTFQIRTGSPLYGSLVGRRASSV